MTKADALTELGYIKSYIEYSFVGEEQSTLLTKIQQIEEIINRGK